MERVKGIEPSYAAWEAAVLPLNYSRGCGNFTGGGGAGRAAAFAGKDAGEKFQGEMVTPYSLIRPTDIFSQEKIFWLFVK